MWFVLVLGVVVIAMTLAMPLSSAYGMPYSESLSVGHDLISVSNGQASVGFSSHTRNVSWDIYELNGNQVSKVNLHVYSVKEYTSTYGPSIGLLLRGDHIQVGELYIMYKGIIDSLISFENLNRDSTTYTAVFNMYLGHANSVSLYGAGGSVANVGMLNSTTINFLLPRTNYGVRANSLSINWMQEGSLFHGGVLKNYFGSSDIELPFGPVTLVSNQSATIDPLISNGQSAGDIYSGDWSLGTTTLITNPSNNAKIGEVLMGTGGQYEYVAGYYVGPTIGVAFSPYNGGNYVVNYVQQTYVWSWNAAGQDDMYISYESNYFQNYQNSNDQQMDDILSLLENLAATGPFPIPQIVAFLNYVNSNYQTVQSVYDGIQITENAGYLGLNDAGQPENYHKPSGKAHSIYGWDESEAIFSRINTLK